MEELLKWYDDNRGLITVNSAEKEVGAPRGTLSYAIKGTRDLPKKYIEPLTILMDSLTAAPSKNVATDKPKQERLKQKPVKVAASEDKPVQIAEPVAPMLQHSRSTHTKAPANVQPSKKLTQQEAEQVSPSSKVTRTETTASGIVVKFRDRYPSNNDKNGGTYKLIKDEERGKPKTYFNGTCYMKTGNHTAARYAFNLEDLN